MQKAIEVQLVVFDWAGTAVDHGCFAPVIPFIQAFQKQGISLDSETARGPMGIHKKDHIRSLFVVPEISEQWKKQTGQDWNEGDVEKVYADFIPLQLEVIPHHSKLIPGLLETVEFLRGRRIKIATTTGYFREAAQEIYQAARRQGFFPDRNLCADDVSQGRPAPWMIFRHMEKLNVYPPASVVKIGDTVPDIQEGLNAGCWSVGVTQTGSEIGLTREEFASLSQTEQDELQARAGKKLLEAGAHFVVPNVRHFPEILKAIQNQLSNNELPPR